MTPSLILGVIAVYFLLLLVIAHFTGKSDDNNTFFKANKKAPWFLVAFGMIGASLSGVTFISVPGWVSATQLGYMQMVFGYLIGYAFIAFVLIPIYYNLNLTSIYTYLEDRLGVRSYKTGAAFFLLSRVIGASFRLYLVAGVLQAFVFDEMGIPFFLTVLLTIILIWIYTYRAGIKTIIFTDTLQTAFMLLSVCLAIYFISDDLGMSLREIWKEASSMKLNQIFFFDDLANNNNHFLKRFFGGALIALVMTGLDQDMMQKNLACKNIKDAQKNILSMSWLLVPVNFIFMFLGVCLYYFVSIKGLSVPEKADHLFPMVSIFHLPIYAGVIFLIGLIAAAYSSADSALTSLTTSFCIDFLGFEKNPEKATKKTRYKVHIGFSVVLALTIYLFDFLGNESVIAQIFTFATYTYGPLLGLFAFGILTNRKVYDKLSPLVCIISPILSFVIANNSVDWFGFNFGYLILLVNGAITFSGLFILSILKEVKHD